MKYIILLLIAFCLVSCEKNTNHTVTFVGTIKSFNFAGGGNRNSLVAVTLNNNKAVMMENYLVQNSATGDSVFHVVYPDRNDRWTFYTTNISRWRKGAIVVYSNVTTGF